MKPKIVKNYVFEGLGFPVIVSRVQIKKTGTDTYPVINMRRLQDAVFDFFLDNAVRLTGAQIAFIRKYMDMTQQEFASALDLTGHGRVSQWEKSKDQIAEVRPVYLAALRACMAAYRGRKNLGTQFIARMVAGDLRDPEPICFNNAA
jgi:DNA-binding transcriptional regulator YiaG